MFQQTIDHHKGYYLVGDPSFFASPMDERMAVSNGCGSKGIGGDLVPDTMRGLDVSAACDLHDWRYAFSKYRFRSDVEMLGNMARIIGVHAKPDGKWVTVLRLYRATMYCAAVVLFGWHFFRDEKEELL